MAAPCGRSMSASNSARSGSSSTISSRSPRLAAGAASADAASSGPRSPPFAGKETLNTAPPPGRAVDRQAAAVRLDDAEAHGEADSGARACRLRREVRIEDPRADRLGNAGAVVGDLDSEARSVGFGGNPQAARRLPLLEGLLRIHDQVEKHLMELIRVARHDRQVRRHSLLHVDAGAAKVVGENVETRVENAVDHDLAALSPTLTSHRQEGLHDTRA